MIETFVILAAAAARFAQGNGHGGPGRWSLLVVMLCAGWFGPLDGLHLFGVETWAVVSLAVVGWATVAFGWTKWGDWMYSLVRYTLPVAFVVATAFQVTGRVEFIYYIAIGPVLTLNYYYIAEHKPQWLSDTVGNRDVAALLAGLTVGSLVLL